MLMLSLVRTPAVTIPWMLNLAIGMLARSLHSGAVVHDAGAIVSRMCRRRTQHRQGLCPNAGTSTPVADQLPSPTLTTNHPK